MNETDEQFELLKSLGWGCPWCADSRGWVDCRPYRDDSTPVEETMNIFRLAGYHVQPSRKTNPTHFYLYNR